MIVNEETLREAAFQLLASSTARRYIREARRIAAECGLVDRVRSDPAQYEQVRDRTVELLVQLNDQRERSRVEFEAAILLCALSGTGSRDAADILRQASRATSSWIRALAGRLSALGPPTSDEIQELRELKALLPGGRVANPQPLRASDRPAPERSDRCEFPRVA